MPPDPPDRDPPRAWPAARGAPTSRSRHGHRCQPCARCPLPTTTRRRSRPTSFAAPLRTPVCITIAPGGPRRCRLYATARRPGRTRSACRRPADQASHRRRPARAAPDTVAPPLPAGGGHPWRAIGAGFVRNRVWDAISNIAASPERDVDVAYFD
ncbi:nucleotidyltransferase family protein, partial [Micromonospora sp. NPDC049060]|uniref:nucleotidyltransferase family protein n=1 Tax=Micromonospora sp. NPDC049060 TaxID=3154828 RepID=UPI0033EF558E